MYLTKNDVAEFSITCRSSKYMTIFNVLPYRLITNMWR